MEVCVWANFCPENIARLLKGFAPTIHFCDKQYSKEKSSSWILDWFTQFVDWKSSAADLFAWTFETPETSAIYQPVPAVFVVETKRGKQVHLVLEVRISPGSRNGKLSEIVKPGKN
ncbi:hypothetical protein D5086_019567 [Populus alba]|uniref:Uncharacterized protein n=1 Tax=Populus alba TaxID=43335 RepID=A0ACC4BHL2_POPAL